MARDTEFVNIHLNGFWNDRLFMGFAATTYWRGHKRIVQLRKCDEPRMLKPPSHRIYTIIIRNLLTQLARAYVSGVS